MPAGAKPGERRGGRGKNTPNKRTIGQASYREQHAAKPTQQHFDSLEAKRSVVGALMRMATEEQAKRINGEKYDPKFLRDTLDSANRALDGLLPYEHRRLATLEPAMETVVKSDGSVHVTISRTDSEL